MTVFIITILLQIIKLLITILITFIVILNLILYSILYSTISHISTNSYSKFVFYFVCLLGSELKGDSRVRVLSGGRQLQISSAEKADAFSYTCLATSAAGSAMKEYNLQVYGT